MSDETPAAGKADMMRLWFDMASHAAEAYQAVGGAAVSPEEFRKNRSNLYKVWGDYWEEFLRSPPFLEAQQQIMGGSLESRKKLRDYLGWLYHEMQLPSLQDIDQVMRAIRRLGEDIGDQFEQLDRRLEKVSTQLDALGQRPKSLENQSSVPPDSAPKPRNRTKQNRPGRST